jgi:hypothetical protein
VFHARAAHTFQHFTRFQVSLSSSSPAHQDIDWPASWAMTFPKALRCHTFTSFAHNQEQAFASKLFLDILPTQEVFKHHYPDTFEQETLDYMGNCPA